jgi:flavin reductase (DIM6/NTAB) family NADH-FMN oxidoreductase RutF
MDKKAMYRLTYGLFIVTTHDGKDNGCITNTAIQVTTTPNQIALAVNKENYTHDAMLKTGIFNVSIISTAADFALFQRFGFQSGRDTDKFSGFENYKRAANGVTFITEGTNAVLCCKLVNTVDLGTHTLFVAEVTDAEVLSDTAPATYAYYLAEIKPKPAAKVEKTVWRCKICGYEYVGEELPDDFTCPLCKHPKEDFEKVTAN